MRQTKKSGNGKTDVKNKKISKLFKHRKLTNCAKQTEKNQKNSKDHDLGPKNKKKFEIFFDSKQNIYR